MQKAREAQKMPSLYAALKSIEKYGSVDVLVEQHGRKDGASIYISGEPHLRAFLEDRQFKWGTDTLFMWLSADAEEARSAA